MGKARPAPRETAAEKKKAAAGPGGAKGKHAQSGAASKKTQPVQGKPVQPRTGSGPTQKPSGQRSEAGAQKPGKPAPESRPPAGSSPSKAKPAPDKGIVTPAGAAGSAKAGTPTSDKAAKLASPEPGTGTAGGGPQQVGSVSAAASRPPAATVKAPASEQKSVPAQVVPAPQEVSEPLPDLDGVCLPAARGAVGVFGGPKDRSMKPDDKLGLPTGRHFQYEQARTLRPGDFYCSMRWEYRQKHMSSEEGKRWWANKKLLVTNTANGRSVVVRAVDFGPHESTGHAIGISPAAAESIGIEAGQDVSITFADQKRRPGPVEE